MNLARKTKDYLKKGLDLFCQNTPPPPFQIKYQHEIQEKKHVSSLESWLTYYEHRVEIAETDTNDVYNNKFPKVSILIITYNNVLISKICLHSIYCNTAYPNFEVIVIDNASNDETPAWLITFSKDHPNLKVILNQDNLGFSGGNNQAAREATGQYLIFLNNDTVVTQGWIERMLIRFQSDPKMGLVGPVTNATGNEALIPVSYNSPAEMEAFARARAAAMPMQSFDIRMLAFYCVMARKDQYESLGGLDERYSVGMFEDDDLAIRYHQEGLRVVCAEDVFIHHFQRASFGKLDDETYQKIFEENKKKYEEKWGRAWVPYQLRKHMLNHPNNFYLDEDSVIEVTGTPKDIVFSRWMKINHCVDKRDGLVIIVGEKVHLKETLKIEKDTHLYIRYSAALPNISAVGMFCEIMFTDTAQSGSNIPVAILHLNGGQQSLHWRTAEFDLSFIEERIGYFTIRCYAATGVDPKRDWFAISDFVLSREDQLSLTRANSFHNQRSHNELNFFSSLYREDMYTSVQNHNAANASGPARPIRQLTQSNSALYGLENYITADVEPLPDEVVYSYAERLLKGCISHEPPDFTKRLKSKSHNGHPIKILSLCSGAARIEAGLAAQFNTDVEWSLLDINADLLTMASKQFAPSITLDLIKANVNDLTYSGEKWDIILCVSGLHHLVNLESIIKFCHDSLNKDGEFWSIGEYVGRNGNRLWPEARKEANRCFQQLPEKYRLNRFTKQVDSEVPDNDYSVGCFEGIRSEDIEPILNRWFEPIHVYRYNCFLWRLTNLTYSENYDLNSYHDRGWIRSLVNSEANHFREFGRGTSLFAVYKPIVLSVGLNNRCDH